MADKQLEYGLNVEPSGDLDAPEQVAQGVEHLDQAAEQAAPALERLESAATGAASGLDKAGREAQEAGDQASRSEGRFQRLKVTLTDLKGVLLGGLGISALVAGFKRLVTGGAEFEEQIKRVGEISGASAGDLERIKQKALELGESTSKTATDAAAAAEVLVRSGQSVEQSLATLPPVLALAEAEGLSLAASADIVVGSLAAYGRGAEDAVAQTDLLFKTSKSAKTDVSALGAAWAEAGPLAKAAGQDFETTAASLGVLADAQLEGTKGGTALKTILASLASTDAPKARQALADLGLTADDVNPSMRGLVDIVDSLAASGLDMNQALALVGREGASALLNLVSKREKLGELRDELKNLDNDTQRAAESIRDQLKGDLQGLGSAVETVSLTISQNMSPSLRAAVQDLTSFFRSSGEGATVVGKSLGTVIELINASVSLLSSGFKNLLNIGVGSFKGLEVEALNLAASIAEAFGRDLFAEALRENARAAAEANSEAQKRVIEEGEAFERQFQTILERIGQNWSGTAQTVEESGEQAGQAVETLGGRVDEMAARGAQSVNQFEQAWLAMVNGVSRSAELPEEKFQNLVDFFSRLDFQAINAQLSLVGPETEAQLREEFDRLTQLLAENAAELPQVVHDNLKIVAEVLETTLPESLERVGVSIEGAVQATGAALSGFGDLAEGLGTQTQKAADAVDQGAEKADQAAQKWVQTAEGLKLIQPRLETFAEDVGRSQDQAANGLERGARAADQAADQMQGAAGRYDEAGRKIESGARQASQAGTELENATQSFGKAAEQAGRGAEQVGREVDKAADNVKRSADGARQTVAETDAAAQEVRVTLDQVEQRLAEIRTAVEQPIVLRVEVDLTAVVDLRREAELARQDLENLLTLGGRVREELL